MISIGDKIAGGANTTEIYLFTAERNGNLQLETGENKI